MKSAFDDLWAIHDPDRLDDDRVKARAVSPRARLREAADLLSEHLSEQSPNEWNRAGLAFQKDGQLEAAIDAFSRALSAEESYASFYNRGIAWWQMGELSKALADLEAAARIAEDRADVNAARMKLYVQMKDFKQARILAGIVARESPEDAAAHYEQAAMTALEGESASSAGSALAKAIDLDPTLAERWREDERFKGVWGDVTFKSRIGG